MVVETVQIQEGQVEEMQELVEAAVMNGLLVEQQQLEVLAAQHLTMPLFPKGPLWEVVQEVETLMII